MKKYILFLPVFFALSVAYGQSLSRDNLFGLHVLDVNLNEGVTMDQFQEFFINELIPEYEKHFIGLKGYIVRSVRGEHKDKLGLVWIFATEPTRDYYFNEDGTPNDFELENLAKVKPKEEELKEKFGSYEIHYKDDWVVEQVLSKFF